MVPNWLSTSRHGRWSSNEIEIIIDKELKKDIVDIKKIGNRVIDLKFAMEQYIFNVIG